MSSNAILPHHLLPCQEEFPVFSSEFYDLRSKQNGVGALHAGAALLVFNRAVLLGFAFVGAGLQTGVFS